MATTVLQSFSNFKQNLEITGLQENIVSTRQANVREAVQKEMVVSDTFLTGSYKRSTMIAPLAEADIDIFVVLDVKYFWNYNAGQNGGQAGLLDALKRVLRRTYTRTPDIGRNGQAVSIRFEDFLIDVVPGFTRQGGGYLIPNSQTQSWISTDPQKHVAISSAANAAHNGDLVPLVKMIKAWNRTHGSFFRSFHLEVMAWSVLDRVAISNYWSGVRYFFDKARFLVSKPLLDPVGYGGNVGNYLLGGQKLQEAGSKMQAAYERALKAEEFLSIGRNDEAIAMWRKIFGDYFPAYG
ncbi:MAG: hypothetical protein QOE70_216 [Chthoniobacter sp.]|jgi:hypothetical protein|nr:hypothetical protein [Chthoniobacter sp.]